MSIPRNPSSTPKRAVPTVEQLAASVRLHRRLVAEAKAGYMAGAVSYDELAQAGRELSQAMFEYSRARFPGVKARKIPYQAVIR